VENNNVRKVAVRNLVERIKSKDIVEGGRLMPERELEKRLAISRPLLRQALAVLEAFGMVEIRDRAGIFVNDAQVADVHFLDYPVDLLPELLQIRIFIEPGAAAIAAECRTESDLAQLNEASQEMGRLLNSGDPDRGSKIERWNSIFHCAIVGCAKNRFLLKMYQNLSEVYQEASLLLRREGPDLPYGDHDREVQREHELIITAIERRDAEQSKTAVLSHLRNSYERDLRNMDLFVDSNRKGEGS
jgi:GntR family transcriptional repressor for pyruvate dehydrogenase complex